MLRRPARDFVSAVSGRTGTRAGQCPPYFRPQAPPHPCRQRGRSRPRRTVIVPLPRSTSDHLRPSASLWRSVPAARGVGAALIDLAAVVALANGRKRLRLDAWQTNTALHRYYESQGFTHVRTLPYTHRGSGALFEMQLRD